MLAFSSPILSLSSLDSFLPRETQHPLKKNASRGENECVDLDLSSLGEAGNGFSGGCGSLYLPVNIQNKLQSWSVGKSSNLWESGKLSAICLCESLIRAETSSWAHRGNFSTQRERGRRTRAMDWLMKEMKRKDPVMSSVERANFSSRRLIE